jgi:hypothetical protein
MLSLVSWSAGGGIEAGGSNTMEGPAAHHAAAGLLFFLDTSFQQNPMHVNLREFDCTFEYMGLGLPTRIVTPAGI